jgi:hypothetical protein
MRSCGKLCICWLRKGCCSKTNAARLQGSKAEQESYGLSGLLVFIWVVWAAYRVQRALLLLLLLLLLCCAVHCARCAS